MLLGFYCKSQTSIHAHYSDSTRMQINKKLMCIIVETAEQKQLVGPSLQ